MLTIIPNVERAKEIATAELEVLSKDQELANRVAQKVFENTKKGLEKILQAFPDINLTYTITDGGDYYPSFISRFI